MTKAKKRLTALGLVLALVFAAIGIYLLPPRLVPADKFGFARSVSEEEAAVRRSLVDTACSWYGANEQDGSHHFIIDIYNTLDPLPRDYRVTYEDSWCAAFATAAAMECGLTDIIPPECSCSRQIAAFRELGRWEEDDSYLPLPGDYIYYDWDIQTELDCTHSPEHVGIVVGTYGPFILVMEGNKDDRADYRAIWRNDFTIRGYGLPDYAGITN